MPRMSLKPFNEDPDVIALDRKVGPAREYRKLKLC